MPKGLRQLSPTDESGDVRPEPCYSAARGSVNGDVALVADEVGRLNVVDHHTVKLQIAVSVIDDAVRKKNLRSSQSL